MLHTADFPLPGSHAVLDGQPVKIHQLIDRETVLVFGDRIQRRATIAELSPPTEASLFERWLRERIVAATDPMARTRVRTAHEDFLAYLAKAQGDTSGAGAPSLYVFTRMMRHAGHSFELGTWREPGEQRSYGCRLFRFTLRSAR